MNRLLADLGKRPEFPAAAAVVARLRKVVGDDTSSALDVARVILEDPGLSSKVLRVVNSAFYRGQGASTSTITRSVFMLGFDAVRDLATGIALLDQIAKAAGAHSPVQVGLTRSLLSGLMARALAARVRYGTPEEAYLLGLFASWGALWLAAFYPREFERAERLAVRRRVPLDAAIREVFGVPPDDLAGRILGAWGLPACYAEYFQAEVPRGRVRHGSSTAMLFGVVHLADGYAAAYLRGEGREAPAPLVRRFTTMFGLDADAFHAAADQAIGEFADHATLLGITAMVPDGGDVEEDAGPALETGAAAPAADAVVAPGLHGSVAAGESAAVTVPADVGEAASVLDGARLALGIVCDVTNAILTREDVNRTLSMILEGIARSGDFRFVLLAIPTPGRQRLVGRLAYGDGAGDYAARLDLPLQKGAGLLADVVLGETAHVVQRARGDLLVRGGPALPGSEPASLVVQPVIGRGRVVGALVAGRESTRPVTPEARELVQLFASQTGLALDAFALPSERSSPLKNRHRKQTG